MSSKEINSTRRVILSAAGAVPALAAILMARKEKAVEVPPLEMPEEQPSSVGYHETDHIRKYYYTAGYF